MRLPWLTHGAGSTDTVGCSRSCMPVVPLSVPSRPGTYLGANVNMTDAVITWMEAKPPYYCFPPGAFHVVQKKEGDKVRSQGRCPGPFGGYYAVIDLVQ